MAIKYQLEDLLVQLHRTTPAKVDAIRESCRRSENGLLSVGLKIHYLGEGAEFDPLIDALGGAEEILVNHYRNTKATLCFVLPPVGNAHAAIWLLQCIERSVGIALFNNPQIQIQVCTPGRIDKENSAILAMCFYLGSDVLRRYNLNDFETTFTTYVTHPMFGGPTDLSRGMRIVLYDAYGDFDKNFEWWKIAGRARALEIAPQLPFDFGRSDVLTATSPVDVRNINLVATLLVHATFGGYWEKLGKKFVKDFKELLDRHMLTALLGAPWLRTDEPETFDNDAFYAALQELTAYALGEAERLKKLQRRFFAWRNSEPDTSILEEVHDLLAAYRKVMRTEALRFIGEEKK
ncbi:MAG: hypothetical protein ABA06_03985 [Parcubacteria bacterium C7867-001]|nr:MAG: hypothetical protein ABA06_03985 [Parcubacteria bacterium C7867-001]